MEAFAQNRGALEKMTPLIALLVVGAIFWMLASIPPVKGDTPTDPIIRIFIGAVTLLAASTTLKKN